MLLTTYFLLLLLCVGLTVYATIPAGNTYFGIAGGALLLILGITLIGGEPITTETSTTKIINTTNASAASPDKTVTVTPVREEISQGITQFIQWMTLLGGLTAVGVFIKKVNDPGEEEGVHSVDEF